MATTGSQDSERASVARTAKAWSALGSVELLARLGVESEWVVRTQLDADGRCPAEVVTCAGRASHLDSGQLTELTRALRLIDAASAKAASAFWGFIDEVEHAASDRDIQLDKVETPYGPV